MINDDYGWLTMIDDGDYIVAIDGDFPPVNWQLAMEKWPIYRWLPIENDEFL